MSASPSVGRAIYWHEKYGQELPHRDTAGPKSGDTMVKPASDPKPKCSVIMAHPTRFERVTFAFGEQ